jgi:putative membrane protein
VGILLAIVLLAHLIENLLHTEPVLMASLFVGLVAGSVVIAWRMIKAPATKHVWVAIGTGVAVFIVLGMRSGTTEETVSQLAEPAMWAFFVAGAIAIVAMILPGISGSFILVMLGMYGAVLGAVTSRDFASLIVFTIGAVVGLGLFSQVLNRALINHHDVVIATLVGLMAGSLRVLWPWPLGVDSTELGVPDSDVGLSIVMVVVGFATMIVIAAVARRVGDGDGGRSMANGVSTDDGRRTTDDG